MARLPTDTTYQQFEYSKFLSDDTFTRNQYMPNGIFQTWSRQPDATERYIGLYTFAGRFSGSDDTVESGTSIVTEKQNNFFLGNPDIQTDYSLATQSMMTIGNYHMIDGGTSWYDIPLIPYISSRGGSGDVNQNSLKWGWDVTQKPSIFGQLRAVTNWKYNDVFLVPLIVAWRRRTNGTIYADTANEIGIKEWFDNPVWSRFNNSDEIIGFNIEYDIYTKTEGALNRRYAFLKSRFCGGFEWDFKAGTQPFIIQDGHTTGNGAGTGELQLIEYEQTLGVCANGANLLYGTSMCVTETGRFQYLFIGNTNLNTHEVTITQNLRYDTPYNCDVLFGNHERLLEFGGLAYGHILNMALQKGLPVVMSTSTANLIRGHDVADWANEHTHYPIIDLDTGEILAGSVYGQAILTDSEVYRETSEDGGKGLADIIPEFVPDRTPAEVDPNEYVDEIPLNIPSITPVGKFSRWYSLSANDIDDLLDFLYTGDPTSLTTILDGVKLNGENPMNFLIGLRMFPFNINNYISTQSVEIGFGNGVATGVYGNEITESNFIIDLGSCYFPRYFKNFLDYEPYTTAKLYIPYCNEISIPTSIFVGHTIRVKMIVDIMTGNCVAVVFCDKLPMYYVNGTISCELQITGENATVYVNAAKDMIASGASAIGTLVGAGVSASAGASAASTAKTAPTPRIANGARAQAQDYNQQALSGVGSSITHQSFLTDLYEWYHQPTPLEANGTNTAMTSFFKPQRCYFIIESPVPMDLEGFAEFAGYATMKYAKPSSLSGLFIAHNPNVQPEHATEQETAEINNLLATGVWR